jgi:CheY-like chemotaxis protein
LIANFEVLLRQAGKEVMEFRLDLGVDLWLNNIDQGQFLAALLNLTVNARDAVPRGGVMTIETRNVRIDPETAASLTEITPGSYVKIVVRDTGEGMTPEVKARAIEPFYTTKGVGRGSGLGLSQVYGFVRQSNGQMTITSEVGHGTSVTLYLPTSTLHMSDVIDLPQAQNDGSLGTILAVEDDPDVLEIAIEAIRSFGYNVYPANDANDALRILQQDLSIDVLFTDVIMPPGVNGVELAQNALRLRPSLRILLASGYPRDALETHEVFAQTNMTFIRKPYTLSALNAQLGFLVRGS